MNNTISESAKEARARRAARRCDLVARKSRWRVDSPDNHGEFMLVDPYSNTPVAGFKYDLSADGVLDYCKREPDKKLIAMLHMYETLIQMKAQFARLKARK